MTVQEIINLSLANTHTNAAQVGAANLLIWFNIVRRKLRKVIVTEINEHFFYDIWLTDAVVNRANGEYPFPQATSIKAGMDKLIKLGIKWNGDSYFTPCHEMIINSPDAKWDERLITQSKGSPVYYVADNSYFVAPNFTTDDLIVPTGNYQIKVEGTKKFVNLTAADLESAILIPEDFHEIIALGMEPYIYKNRGLTALKNDAKLEFKTELIESIQELAGRDISEMSATLPDETALE